MRTRLAGALGGAVGAAIMSGAMLLGRRYGLLHETLSERSEHWLDETFDVQRIVGPGATTALEQASHVASGIAFGAAYAAAKPRIDLPPVAAGALYGAALYALNIVGVAPAIGRRSSLTW